MISSPSPSQFATSRFDGVSADPFRWMAWGSIGLLAVMLFSTALVSRTIDTALRKTSGRALGMILGGNVAELRLYLTELQTASEQLALQKSVGLALQADASSDARALGIAAAESRVKQQLATLPSVVEAWVITDNAGKILSSSSEEWVGKVCVWSDSNRLDLQQRRSTLVLPNELSSTEDLTLFSLSPVFSDFEWQGTVGWCFNPRANLSDRFVNNQSESVFMFDRSARVLNRTDLDTPPSTSVSENQTGQQDWEPASLRVPGESSTLPLTVMAEQATRGASGFDTDGYLNHRGVEVIAAWQWLPEYGLGMAVEADVSEVFYPIHVLSYLTRGLMASVLVSGLGIAVCVVRTKRLVRRQGGDPTEVRRLGQYDLIELLGVGGMGSVYRGRHEFLRRDVAIKVLEGEQLSKQAVTRFRREVQSTSKLRHPNTIAIYDYGQAESLSPTKIRESATGSSASKRSQLDTLAERSDGGPGGQSQDNPGVFYYVMEYVDGITLQQLIDYYGPQSPERTIHLLLQICGSIAEAHQAGLIHRDIKPGNILLCAESNSYDHIKVLDFGLVKDINSTDTVAVTMTRSDSMTGTPLYMAPETIRDATQASSSGDLYSIGAVGYALLTGKPTYEGESAIDLCLKQLEEVPISPSIRLGRPLPQGLQDCIMSCLSLNSAERPATIGELVKRLDSLPESTGWNQVDSADWWENVFEANRKKLPAATKSDTVADQPLEGVS